MRLSIILFLFFNIFFTKNFSQDCDKLLQGGLYSFTSMTNTGGFSKDLRTYYLSEQFKTDMKSGKWGSSLTLPIEGIPITLGIDFSDNQYNEFRNKLLKVSDLNIKSNYYKTVFSTIPNTNLYQAYVDCKKITEDVSKTGFIQGTNIETESTVVFAIYYRPQAPRDPMPIVQVFNVEPAGSVISGNLTQGQKLSSFSILVTCKRDQDKDLVLSLITDRGSLVSKSVAEGSFTSSSNIPIGTVITSFLTFDKFSEATKNNEKSPGGVWTSSKSKWAPCDGRPLPYSKYSKYASVPNAPDLRGLFLRGYSSFDPAYTINPSNPSQQQAKPSPVGIYQSDMVGEHKHTYQYPGYHGSDKLNGGGNYPRVMLEEKANNLIEYNIGGENIPKNVSIYYYIKIN